MACVQMLAYSQSGRNIASVGDDGVLRWHDGYTGDVLYSREAHLGQILSVDIDMRHRFIAIGTGLPDFQVRFFRLPDLEPWAMATGFQGCVYDVKFSADGGVLAACESAASGSRIAFLSMPEIWTSERPSSPKKEEGRVVIFDKLISKIRMANLLGSLSAIRKDETDEWVNIYVMGPNVKWLRLHENAIFAIAWNPYVEYLASGDFLGVLAISSTGSSPKGWMLNAHEKAINAVCFDPRGQSILTAGDDGCVIHWLIDLPREGAPDSELPQIRKRDTINLKLRAVNSMDISPDGKNVCFGTQDGYVILWNLLDWQESTRLNIGNEVTTIAFSPTGTRLALGDSSGAVYVMDLKNINIGEPVVTPILTNDYRASIYCPYCWERNGDSWEGIQMEDMNLGRSVRCPGGCGHDVFLNRSAIFSFYDHKKGM